MLVQSACKEELRVTEIIMYHGLECPHCLAMMPLVDRLEKEEEVRVTKKEVWHNEENKEEMRSRRDLIAPACGGSLGVPCFFSEKTNKVLCGEVSYRKFKKWVAENK